MNVKQSLTLAGLLASSSLCWAASVNIANPGFENSFNDWREYEQAAVSSDSRTGNSSAKLLNSTGQLRQKVSVSPNTNYELSAYIKGAGKIGVNTGSAVISSKVSGATDWTKVTVSFASDTSNEVDIFLKYNGAEGRFDDFRLDSADPQPGTNAVTVPARIQAEDYVSYFDTSAGNTGGQYRSDDVDIQVTTDTGSGFNVGWFVPGEYLEYAIAVNQSGNYTAKVRVATIRTDAQFFMSVDGTQQGTNVNVPNLGNWQTYSTVDVNLGFLSAGTHTLRLTNANSGFNLNWIDVAMSSAPPTSTACTIDMSIWGYTLSDGISRNDKSDIQDLIDNKTLGASEIRFDDGCVTFKAPNIGTTSSGSNFVRAELRELVTMYIDDRFDDTDIENQWVTSEASAANRNDAGGVDGKMTATLKVNTVSVDYAGDADDQVGRIIVGQIHGVDHEPVKIYYQKMPDHSKGSVYFTVDGADGKPKDRVYVIGYSDKDYEKHANGSATLSNPANGIALGEKWSYEINLAGNQLNVTVWHNGNMYTTADSIAYSRTQSRAVISNASDVNAITLGSHFDNDLMYFKAGLYNQNNTGTNSPNYAEVTFYQIDVEHY
jgi:hypothetical protein